MPLAPQIAVNIEPEETVIRFPIINKQVLMLGVYMPEGMEFYGWRHVIILQPVAGLTITYQWDQQIKE